MKNFTKILLAFLCIGLVFASCNKDNFDYEQAEKDQIEQARLEKIRIDALKKEQAPLLEAYAKSTWGNEAKYSDFTGIWYTVELAPSNETPYVYKATVSGYGQVGLSIWAATVNFKGELMDGTVFDKNTDGVPKNYTDIRQATSVYGSAWVQAFAPTVVNVQGKDVRFEGLLPKGLQKGDKISFISPSYYTFDQEEYTKGSEKVTVPKNTPVVYTIEVITVGDVGSN